MKGLLRKRRNLRQPSYSEILAFISVTYFSVLREFIAQNSCHIHQHLPPRNWRYLIEGLLPRPTTAREVEETKGIWGIDFGGIFLVCASWIHRASRRTHVTSPASQLTRFNCKDCCHVSFWHSTLSRERENIEYLSIYPNILSLFGPVKFR